VHPSCHGHFGNTSSDDGDYEERLGDPNGCYNPIHSDDPTASSSRVGVDLSEEP